MPASTPGMPARWFLAARPKTLWAAVGPVMMGTAMAHGERSMNVCAALVALLGAVLLQIGTNFCNDYSDFKKGADTPHRVGPARAVASGWITPGQMLSATIITFSLACISCSYLIYLGGWPIAILGVASILAGIIYTAGAYPLAYMGLGDLFVLIFFGPIAVAGTYYVQTLQHSWLAVIAGFGPGLLSVAILTVNNLRDIDSDRLAGKKTLAVRFGEQFARSEYAGCLLLAAVLPLIVARISVPVRTYAGVAGFIIFAGWPVIRLIFSRRGGALNPGLGMTAMLLFVYCLAFSIGWLIDSP